MENEERPAPEVFEITDVHRVVSERMQDLFPEELTVRGEVGRCTFGEDLVVFRLFARSEPELGDESVLFAYLNGRRLERVVSKCRRQLRADDVELSDLVAEAQPIVLKGRVEYQPEQRRLEFRVDDLDPFGTIEEVAREREVVAERLEHEGVLAAQRDLRFTSTPVRVSIVGSPDSQAVREVRRRFDGSEHKVAYELHDCAVRGNGAIRSVADAIGEAVKDDPAAVLVVRDPGPVWEYAPFQSEGVARAITEAGTPVVTGLGAPDPTLSDDAAHTWASDAAGAAEVVLGTLDDAVRRLTQAEDALLDRAVDSYEHHRAAYEEVRVAIETAKAPADDRAERAASTARRLLTLFGIVSAVVVVFLAIQTELFVWVSVAALAVAGWLVGWLMLTKRNRAEAWRREWRESGVNESEGTFDEAIDALWEIEGRLDDTTRVEEISALMDRATALGRRCRDLLHDTKQAIERFGGD